MFLRSRWNRSANSVESLVEGGRVCTGIRSPVWLGGSSSRDSASSSLDAQYSAHPDPHEARRQNFDSASGFFRFVRMGLCVGVSAGAEVLSAFQPPTQLPNWATGSSFGTHRSAC